MRIKFSITLPVGARGAVTLKTQRSFARALSIARQRIIPLVMDRATAMVDKQSPALSSRYKKALTDPRVIEVTEKEVTLKVTDPLVLAVERGSKGFDMKSKLLAHATKSSKKGGPYIDVPFNHKASEVPSSMKSAMSRAAKKSGGAAEVRMAMKTDGKAFTRQLQRGRIGQALGMSPKKQKVQHKRGIHDDMTRRSTKTGSRSSNTYTTVRRISLNSATTSWWHPGFKAAHVLDKVLPSLKRDVAAILRDALVTVRNG
jgi:hypothetical protein